MEEEMKFPKDTAYYIPTSGKREELGAILDETLEDIKTALRECCKGENKSIALPNGHKYQALELAYDEEYGEEDLFLIDKEGNATRVWDYSDVYFALDLADNVNKVLFGN